MNLLYQIMSTAFCVIMILSNIISAKLIPLPYFNDYCIPAGLITYPLTFLLSDLVTEFFGTKNAKKMVLITLGMNILTFGILQIALIAPGHSSEMQEAFHHVLGLSGLRIFASLVAYSCAQFIDIQVYAAIKRWTGLRHLWVRANGSTWISQLVDTLCIDLLFLYWGMQMPLTKVVPIILFSFAYKALFSLVTTPLFYLLFYLLKKKAPY
jgi:queuosine precursor transporter